MTQSYLAKPPFTDSNYPLPQSIVSRCNKEPAGEDNISSVVLTEAKQEPPRKADIFKKIPRQSPTTAPLSHNSILEGNATENKPASSASSTEVSKSSKEPLKPPPSSIFKKISRPPETSICSTVSTEINKTHQQPMVTAPATSRKPLFITPPKKVALATILESIPLDNTPLGSIGTATKATRGSIIRLDNMSTGEYHKPALDYKTPQLVHGQNEKTANLQPAEELHDLTDDLIASANQRRESSDDYISTCRSRVTAQGFDDDFSDII